MFLKHDGLSDQTPIVPGVEYSFSGVVGHHGVVAELIGELNVGVPPFSSLGVVCKVDGNVDFGFYSCRYNKPLHRPQTHPPSEIIKNEK